MGTFIPSLTVVYAVNDGMTVLTGAKTRFGARALIASVFELSRRAT
jgi:hypothetical protein